MKKILLFVPLVCNAMQIEDTYTKEEAKAYHDNCQVQQYCARRLLKKMIETKMIGQEDTILDVGCGPGIITDFMARHIQGPVVGIDSSYSMIECAQKHYKRGNLRFERADIRFFQPHDRFDVLTVLDMTYQDNKVVSVFRAIKNCLKINGLVAVVLPSPQKQEEIDLLKRCFEKTETDQTRWELIHCTSKEDTYLYPDLQKLIDTYKTSVFLQGNRFEDSELKEFMQDYLEKNSTKFKRLKTGGILGPINWWEIIAKKIHKLKV